MPNTNYDTLESNVQNAGRQVVDEASAVASEAAHGIADAASRVQNKAAAFGKTVSNQFSATTDYFREHDMQDIAADVKSWVQKNPTQALIAAAALGFVTATLIRRR